MAWVKLDDGFTDNPKVESVSDRAFRLHVAGMCFCGRMLSDGHIPTDRVRRLLPKVTKGMVDELIGAGLWLKEDNGFRINDYLLYNPSRAKVLEEREATAERKRKWTEKQKAGRDASRNASGNAIAGTVPRPDPSRPEGSRDGSVSTPLALVPSPAPSGGDGEAPKPDTSLSPEQKALNIKAAKAAKDALKGGVA